MNGLALSVTFGDSSPKGRASGETGNFVWTAKASPFGRGGFAKQRRRGRGRFPKKHTPGQHAELSGGVVL